jgi:hypothetical protein
MTRRPESDAECSYSYASTDDSLMMTTPTQRPGYSRHTSYQFGYEPASPVVETGFTGFEGDAFAPLYEQYAPKVDPWGKLEHSASDPQLSSRSPWAGFATSSSFNPRPSGFGFVAQQTQVQVQPVRPATPETDEMEMDMDMDEEMDDDEEEVERAMGVEQEREQGDEREERDTYGRDGTDRGGDADQSYAKDNTGWRERGR